MADTTERRASFRIFQGLLVGVALGALLQYYGDAATVPWILKNVIDPLGTAFLRALFMVVAPLVFCSLASSVASLGSLTNVGRIGGRLAVFYVLTTLVAIVLGQCLVAVLRPGAGIPAEQIASARAGFATQVEGLMEKSAQVHDSLWPGLVSVIIPKNIFASLAAGEMLAIIFSSVLLGLALLQVQRERRETTLRVLEALSEAAVVAVGWIMKAAPYCVAALMAGAVARFGMGLLANVAKYVGVVLAGYAIHFFVTYGIIVRTLVKMPFRQFLSLGFPAIATAFGTSSSNATIPATIQTLEERFGVPSRITNFSVPLGATVNMDGTALFEMVAALFVAQVFGVEITLLQHAQLILLVLVTSVGVAGVPGGSIPILMSAMATMGIPPEGIALVLGVDRLLDMGRTTLNVTGDLTAALVVHRREAVGSKS